MRFLKFLPTQILSVLFVFTLVGCNDKKSDDLTVHWDRDMCSRCVMVISDRHNTVQVISADKRKNVFDDIGCMVIWSQKNPISAQDKIWVNDVVTKEWINARDAFYDAGNITPMGYGFSAHKLKSDIKEGKEVLDYNEVVKRISQKKM
jgi:hypothetical protein